jgi:hypothetical protein
MATYVEIKAWFHEGAQKTENTHMIIVCDTFDYEDYPVYITETKDIHEQEAVWNAKSMQRVIEVYNLKKDMDEQLSRGRCFCY